MIKNIIFDLDGTLLNTIEDLTDAVNYALNKLNLKSLKVKEIIKYVGNGIDNLVLLSLKENKDKFNEAIVYFKDYYFVHCMDKTKPYNNINKMLSILKETGYKVSIVSNKVDEAVNELANNLFENKIDLALGVTNNLNKKPSPDMVNKVIELLNINKEETIYVGDSEVDYLTSVNSNLKMIGVSWGFRGKKFLKKLGVKHIINKPLDIFKEMEKIKND